MEIKRQWQDILDRGNVDLLTDIETFESKLSHILALHGNIYVTEKDRKSMFNCHTQGLCSYRWDILVMHDNI